MCWKVMGRSVHCPPFPPSVNSRQPHDPLISLSFSMQSQKGVYALLLGSGVSRSAQIPTGWEVVLDLVTKLAAVQSEDCGPNPEVWFGKKYSSEPDYSKILDALAATPAERQQLLRNYFEPTEEERSQGLKKPTTGHKAIARLAAGGYIKVILTTNFDRLMERALEEVGITPTVISTLDAIEGSLPLAHSGCTVIKLHGDYRDTRIRNTVSELEAYEEALNRLLDRVFDEYGLIVCGWSGEWDAALRAAILRTSSRRFSTFWCDRGKRGDRANQLVNHRRAQPIAINDADSFFVELAEKVQALEDTQAPHPLSIKALVSTVKRYLPDDSHQIRLFDLLHEETEKLHSGVTTSDFYTDRPGEPSLEIPKRVQKYEALAAPLAAAVVVGCFWGRSHHTPLWIRAMERLAARSIREGTGYQYLIDLQKYPALILFYAGGLSALAAKKYETLKELFLTAQVRDEVGNSSLPFASAMSTWKVMSQDVGHLIPGMEVRFTPVSDRLAQVLRPSLKDMIPDDPMYEDLFDRFEYMLALQYASPGPKSGIPMGRFAWRKASYTGRHSIERVWKEIENEGGNWAALKAGLFGGHINNVIKANSQISEVVGRLRW